MLSQLRAAAARGSAARAGRARTPTPRSSCSRAACRRGRPGRARRSAPLPHPTAADQAATIRGIEPWPSKRRSCRSTVSPDPLHQRTVAFPGVDEDQLAGSTGSARREVGVIDRLASDGVAVPSAIARRSRSSSESTSSRSSSGGNGPALGDQVGLGQQEREDGEPLLALRAEAAQVAGARDDRDLVEVRPEPGRASLQVAVRAAPRGRRGSRALAPVVERGVVEAQLARAARRSRGRAGRASAGAPPRAPRRAPPTRSVQGASASRVDRPSRDAAERRRSAGRAPRRRRPAAPPVRAAAARAPGRSRRDATAGPPLTTASRSGVKTSVASSLRSRSAAVDAGPVQPRLLAARYAAGRPRSRPEPIPARRERRPGPPRRRSGPAARRPGCAARTLRRRRAATRAGSSCRRRSRRPRARCRG